MFMLFFLFSFFSILISLSRCISISISPSSVESTANLGVFGSNLEAYNACLWSSAALQACQDEGKTHTTEMTDMGGGVFDPTKKEYFASVVQEITQELDVSFLRFPGGCGAHLYDWKEAVGSNRSNFLFGVEEFLVFCEENEIEPVYTLSYFYEDNDYLLEFMDFLFSDDYELKREMKADAYKVKYFEFGNEVYHGDHMAQELEIGVVDPEEYANRYVDMREKIKEKYPNVQLGLILEIHELSYEWNKKVLEIVGSNFDFVNPHIYPFSTETESLEIEPKKLYKYALASSYQFLQVLEERLFCLLDDDKKVAVTEFNAGFVQDDPIPYRFAFGSSLVNADEIINLIKLSDRVLFANQWHLINGYWGMIYTLNGKYETLYKRPNYYMAKLLRNFISSQVVKSEIDSGFFTLGEDSEMEDCCSFSIFSETSENITKKQDPISFIVDEWNIMDVEDVVITELKDSINIEFEENAGDLDFYHVYSKSFSVSSDKRYSVEIEVFGDTNITDDGNGILFSVVDSEGWEQYTFIDWRVIFKGDYKGVVKYAQTEFIPSEETESVYFMVRRAESDCYISGNFHFSTKVIVKELEKFQPIPYINSIATRNEESDEIQLVLLNKNLEEEYEISFDFGENINFKIIKIWELKEELDFNIYYESEKVMNITEIYDYDEEKYTLKTGSLVGISFQLLDDSDDSDDDINKGFKISFISTILLVFIFLF